MLWTENLTLRCRRSAAAALREVSLSVDAGERVAIVGPSGSGKTTLFRAISGFAPIENGRILVAVTDILQARGSHLRTLRRGIGVIAQQHDLVERMRVYHNVMAGALGRWSTVRAQRFLLRPLRSELDVARSALERAGVAEKLRARTGELSGGHPGVRLQLPPQQPQRVHFNRASLNPSR